MVDVDYGQAEIAAFKTAAQTGTLQLDPTAVTEAVGLYDRMIAGLYEIRERLDKATDARGFGGFQSAQELQAGSRARQSPVSKSSIN